MVLKNNDGKTPKGKEYFGSKKWNRRRGKEKV